LGSLTFMHLEFDSIKFRYKLEITTERIKVTLYGEVLKLRQL